MTRTGIVRVGLKADKAPGVDPVTMRAGLSATSSAFHHGEQGRPHARSTDPNRNAAVSLRDAAGFVLAAEVLSFAPFSR